MEPESSLPQSQVPATCSYPEEDSPGPRSTLGLFRNIIRFYSDEFLAPRPTPKLEYHPLSAVHNCLFNIFAATLHIGDQVVCGKPPSKYQTWIRSPDRPTLAGRYTDWAIPAHPGAKMYRSECVG
jgi:hypothetical protein